MAKKRQNGFLAGLPRVFNGTMSLVGTPTNDSRKPKQIEMFFFLVSRA